MGLRDHKLPTTPLDTALRFYLTCQNEHIIVTTGRGVTEYHTTAKAGMQHVMGKNMATSWSRALKRGTATEDFVDRVCVHVLRQHPIEIYGNDWWSEEEQNLMTLDQKEVEVYGV
jgi:hypothetical protein